MNTVVVSMGSNVGDRRFYIEKAIEIIDQNPFIEKVKQSKFYETEPVGFAEQPIFLNVVVLYKTTIEPVELLRFFQTIEQQLGRQRIQRWGPREIDIDIVLYGSLIMKKEYLEIPHPEFRKRKFVLVPLIEIAAELIDPVTKLNMQQLLERCNDKADVRVLEI